MAKADKILRQSIAEGALEVTVEESLVFRHRGSTITILDLIHARNNEDF
jgi:hypothetical protein